MTHIESLINKADGNCYLVADDLVADIIEIEQDIKRLGELFEAKVKDLKQKHDDEIARLQAKIEYDKYLIKELKSQLEFKKSKTQHKLKLLNGTILIKKQKYKFIYDSNSLLQYMKEKHPEFVKVNTTETIDWMGVKALLAVESGDVIMSYNGETEQIEGVGIEVVPEELVVEA